GLATEYGSPIYKGRIGTSDAAIVRDLRQRGAILLGKTQCTAFAYRTPPPTRNPRDLEHPPGGSPSGAAAAAAAGKAALCSGNPDQGVGPTSGVILWRDRVQAQPWSFLPGGRSAAREELGHSRILHQHISRHARALESDGASGGADGGFCARSA